MLVKHFITKYIRSNEIKTFRLLPKLLVMTTIDKEGFLDKFEVDLGTFYFYKNYIVSEIKEGTVLTIDKLNDVIPVVSKYYKEKELFSYISNRIYSHSIVPMDYKECPFNNFENFIGYDAVCYNDITKKSVEIEKHFSTKPLKDFSNLDDAIKWTHKEVSTRNK